MFKSRVKAPVLFTVVVLTWVWGSGLSSNVRVTWASSSSTRKGGKSSSTIEEETSTDVATEDTPRFLVKSWVTGVVVVVTGGFPAWWVVTVVASVWVMQR